MVLESGEVDNKTVNTYTVSKNDGTKMVEQVIVNKDDKKVSRKLDNKDVSVSDERMIYQAGNAEIMNIILLKNILKQLIEMNYYLRLQVQDKIVDEKVKEAIKNG